MSLNMRICNRIWVSMEKNRVKREDGLSKTKIEFLKLFNIFPMILKSTLKTILNCVILNQETYFGEIYHLFI